LLTFLKTSSGIVAKTTFFSFKAAVPCRPVTSLGHQEGRKFFWEGQKFLNCVQKFQTMSNIFFQAGRKFF